MKQETLEGAVENKLRVEFENLIRNKTNSDIEFLLESNNTNYILWLESKYQQERSYSEEDMKSFGDWCRNGLLNTEYSVDRLDKHIEQWKQLKNK